MTQIIIVSSPKPISRMSLRYAFLHLPKYILPTLVPFTLTLNKFRFSFPEQTSCNGSFLRFPRPVSLPFSLCRVRMDYRRLYLWTLTLVIRHFSPVPVCSPSLSLLKHIFRTVVPMDTKMCDRVTFSQPSYLVTNYLFTYLMRLRI